MFAQNLMLSNYHEDTRHARIQRGGGVGCLMGDLTLGFGPPPPGKSQSYSVPYQYWSKSHGK